MLATNGSLAAKHPYPGLRSFEAAEAVLFHGRARHVEELLRRLSQTRFLAVVGGSGSGKSSLIRAGLLPALYRGYLTGATTRWRVAVMRPGSAPLAEMTRALADPIALGSASEATIRASSYGLVSAFRGAAVPAGESLLLVVDQFEELFRFRRESTDRDGGAEASLFVSQLLQAADEFGVSIYVVITMRADFLADCAQFPGLPEALNSGQYLIPRMTREQRREAVTTSLELFDAAMSDRLVQRLLNDAGDDPDQLPVLQHALQQTYSIWEGGGRNGDIDLEHYEKAGTMLRALDQHAERVYASTGDSAWIAERIFRCLTVDENGRAVRRPARFDRILRVIGGSEGARSESEARSIVKLFADPENCFLLWGLKPGLEPESVIDISHESLIRKWSRLQAWVRDEAKGVDIYRYLRRDASLYPNDAGLWNDPDLSRALDARRTMGWNQAWAEQYSHGPGAPYAKVQEFLESSVIDRDVKLRRERRLRLLKIGVAALLVVLAIGAIRLYRTELENRASREQRDQLQALNSSLAADNNQKSSDASKLAKRINDLQNTNATAQTAELQRASELERLKAELETENSRSSAKAAELEKQIGALQRTSATDKAAELQRSAELQRLQDEKERTERTLAEREQLIADNKRQAGQSNQENSEFLKRINDLQSQLKKAWDERDAAQTENSRTKQALSQNRDITTFHLLDRDDQNGVLVKQWSPPSFPKDNPLVAFVMSFYSYAHNGPLFVIPLPSRSELARFPSQTDYFLNIVADPPPSCPSGPPLYCVVVHELKTSSEIQQLGTVEIGQSAYALYSWGWVPGGERVVNIAVVPLGPARTASATAGSQSQRPSSSKQ